MKKFVSYFVTLWIPLGLSFPSTILFITSHPQSKNSSDLEKVEVALPALIRGPYLNMVNQTAVTLRWRTDSMTNTKVEIGTVHGTYPTIFNNASLVHNLTQSVP
jgi:hypothetical protein